MQYQLWLPIPILTPIHLGDQNRVFVHPTILTRGSSQSTLTFLFLMTSLVESLRSNNITSEGPMFLLRVY